MSLRGLIRALWREERKRVKRDPVEDDEYPFDILRGRVAEVGACDACKGLKTPGETFVTIIVAGVGPGKKSILLCEFHEGETLQALLRAYLRRVKGKDNIGFSGPIQKFELPTGQAV